MADPTKLRTFRASDADWQRWTEAARAAGMTRSEWIRRALDEAAKCTCRPVHACESQNTVSADAVDQTESGEEPESP